jgi:hypothetical protein
VKIFKDYAVCDEVTRRVKSYGLPINEDGNGNIIFSGAN